MERARWRDRIGPPPLLMSTALLIAVALPAGLTAGPPASASGPSAATCRGYDVLAVSRAANARRVSGASIVEAFELNDLGELTGRRLSVQPSAGAQLSIALPAESFVARPTGNIVLYGGHSPATGSVVQAIDLASGCDLTLARPAEIVRSAVLDPAGMALFVHTVSRDGRRDVGITRQDLLTGTVSLAVGALAESDAFGPTFGTELRWSVDGTALAVQSCGIGSCRTRILDTLSGLIESIDEPHGPLIGLTGRSLFAFEDLHGLPSRLLTFNRQTGVLTTLVDEAFDAHLEPAGLGAVLSIETAAGITEVTE